MVAVPPKVYNAILPKEAAMTTIAEYARPDTIVSTDWVADHLHDPNVRLVEVDVDTSAYQQGHVPCAIAWNWTLELCDTVRRDIIPAEKLEALLGAAGIGIATTVILYGDNNNWFAAWALWQLKLYGHEDVRIMNGGRKKWIAESKPMTTEVPVITRQRYRSGSLDLSLRAFLPEVRDVLRRNGTVLVDVRGPQEFTGEILAPPGLPETCQRGGHIPGAKNIPWAKACNEDGTFKRYQELAQLYEGEGVTRDRQVITYCRIGERSSHTWFALKYLLGYPHVKNYDGSWTEWGNLVGAPVEKP
jgi:thiosulfate/3-mercaptopyruvate sulfurtransferase